VQVSKNTGEAAGRPTNLGARSPDRREDDKADLSALAGVSDPVDSVFEATLLPHERELLHDLLQGLRSIRFGSIVLTVHEGHVVEIEKTVKIRKNRPKS
jgi:hypothetical protein